VSVSYFDGHAKLSVCAKVDSATRRLRRDKTEFFLLLIVFLYWFFYFISPNVWLAAVRWVCGLAVRRHEQQAVIA
jgi:hypothetical protein